MDCLFCKMVNRDIEPDVVYEDEHVLAFNDINPQAPTHVLIVPKKHIATLNDIQEGDLAVIGRLPFVAAKVAREVGFADDGYRVVMNCNEGAGQTVYHIHMHLMGGRRFTWPAG